MTELDHKTLDIGALIAGIGYPELDVEVNLDARVDFALAEAKDALAAAEARDDRETISKLDAEIESLRKKSRASRLTVTLKGIPEAVRKGLDHQAREEFPLTYTAFGMPEANPDRTTKFNDLLWAHSLIRITDPSGVSGVPDVQQIADLRAALGRTAYKAINDGLDRLTEGDKAGFEDAAQDVDFLSDASPEG